jgi:DNA-binding NtrC family response regulator
MNSLPNERWHDVLPQRQGMGQPMTHSIIAVLPQEGDSALIRESLRGQDLELELARSTEAALNLLASTAASVIVYDADTGQPWRDAVRCFLAARPNVRVVLLSQSADSRTWWDLFDCGAYDLITRPFRPADFRAVIRSALDPPQFFRSAV